MSLVVTQGTQLAYSNFLNCQEESAAVHGLQRLQDKTLLEYKPGHSTMPDLTEPWLTVVRSLQTVDATQGVGHLSPGCVRSLHSAVRPSTTCDTQLRLVAIRQHGGFPKPLQSAASFAGIADAVLRMCLRAVGMPGNCLAGVLDDLPPSPDVAPESLLQAASYIGEQLP
jgi:hypothetical protein